MDTKAKNKVKMYNAVETVLTSNSAVWNGIAGFQNAYDSFQGKLAALAQASYEQGTGTLGIKSVKDKERATVAKMALRIAGGLRVLAADTGNLGLKARVDFSKSELSYSSMPDTMQLLERLKEAAVAHTAELANYSITQADIDEYVAAFEQLSEAFGSVRNAIVTRKTHTELIREHLKAIDGILKNRLDQLMEVFEKDHPGFAKQYRIARLIVDLPGKKNKPGKDELPGLPDPTKS